MVDLDRSYADVKRHVEDSATSAWVSETELEPLAGPGTRVCPAKYAGDQRGTGRFAESPTAFLPERGDDGWFSGVIRGGDGRPVTAPSVVIDSVGSQANRVENSLWAHRESLGGLPGLVVQGRDVPDSKFGADAKKTPGHIAEVKTLISGLNLSSWTVPHRHADAWMRFASVDADGKTSLWKRENEVRSLIAGMNTTRDAGTLFEYAPNSLLFGFWLSSGSVERHRQPRAYSAEIVGYGAYPVMTGAARMDRLPASRKVALTPSADGFTAGSGAKDASEKSRPSAFGFGMVPGSPTHTGYLCETILKRASVSLSTLRNVSYGDDPGGRKATAAAVVLTVMGMVGHILAERSETMLRSGCDLTVVETRHGWKRMGERGIAASPEIPTSVEDLSALLALAKEDAAGVGLEFKEPMQLYVSDSEMAQLVLSATLEIKADEDGAA